MFHYAYLITSLAVGQVCIPFHRKIDEKVQDNFLHDIQPLKRQEISANLYKSKKKKIFSELPSSRLVPHVHKFQILPGEF